MDLNKVYNEDCLLGIIKIPDGSIDLVITDPPYGDNVGYGRNNKEILNNESVDINYKIIPELYRVLKDNTCCYLFTNYVFLNDILNFIKKDTNFKYRQLITMVKNNFGMGYGFRNQTEFCIVLEKGKPTYNLNNFSNYYKIKHINHTIDTHPHIKDYILIQKMIKHSSKEGDIVLDPFLGSGTTAISCKQLKRSYIGFELDTKYYALIQKKLNQSSLFTYATL